MASVDQATSTVELALIIPTFLLIILGVFDLSWMAILNNVTSEAAREGGRIGRNLAVEDPRLVEQKPGRLGHSL